MMNETGINYYNPIEREHNNKNDRPLRAAVITSIRDVGECDQNGRTIQLPEFGEVYMMGAVEALIRSNRNSVNNTIEFVGIITDDSEHDVNRGNLNNYTRDPHSSGEWIFDRELRNNRGELISNFTENIPSNFRGMPMRMIDERAQAKSEFEHQVENIAGQMGADILISDHLMLRAEYLVQAFRNRFLNIHPAVTNATNPNSLRGKIPTQDAIDRANGHKINPDTGLVENVNPYFRTGATLHLINEVIDDGPILCDIENTEVRSDDTPQQLRYRNYQKGKIPAFINGLEYYANNIFASTISDVA